MHLPKARLAVPIIETYSVLEDNKVQSAQGTNIILVYRRRLLLLRNQNDYIHNGVNDHKEN